MPAASTTLLESWDGVSTMSQLIAMGPWTEPVSGFSLDAGGFTGQALKSNNTLNSIRRVVGSSMMNGYRAGFRFKTTTVAGQVILYGHFANGGPYATLFRDTSRLLWSHQGFSISTPTGSIAADTWYYVELRFILGNPGGYAEIRLNRIVAAAQSGNTSQFVSHTSIADIYFGDLASSGSNTDANWMIDDWYMNLDADGYLGELRIQVKRPNGNGNYSQGVGSDGDSTDNYLLVDEQSTNDSDYVEFTLDGEKDTYAHSGVSAFVGHTPIALRHVARAASLGPAASIRRVSRRAGTDSTGADTALGFTLAARSNIITTDAAGGDFSFANIDATEFGYELRP